MKLRRRFLIFAILIHCIFIALSITLLSGNKYLFVAAELLILVSLAISIHLYKSFLKPLNLIASGIESIKDQDFSTTFVETGQDELDELIGIYNRMIDQLRKERVKQREQHFFLQRLIDASPMGIVILDLDNNITMINPAAETVLEARSDKVVGRSLDCFAGVPGTQLQGLRPGEARIVSVNGIQTFKCRRSHFLDRGFHRHFILIEELTREILSAQKKAYERVIRMMSHEINNSVGAVNSILQSSLNYSKQLVPDDRRDFEEVTQVAIDRNSSLNRFMSNLADVVRLPLPSMEWCNLHELLRRVQVLMSAECAKRSVNWVWDLSDEPLVVQVDLQQIEQVLVNIIKNAIEAIGTNGTITVCTDAAESRVLRIFDDGKGIALEERPHLFTPFYSTKKDGQGIGLTLIREILMNHGFSFNLESDESGQTLFWIDFRDKR
jgi:nitrogen fixation/metabolism regulation signal transduction histidine kinase